VTWTCSRCDRTFRQVNQRHACGVGSRSALLKNRPPALVDLYGKLEATVKGFGAVEIVARDRYALFRATRIFTDLTVMRDALRVVIHLGREVKAPYFLKIARDGKRVSHVTTIRTSAELRVITPLLREAYELAAEEESREGRPARRPDHAQTGRSDR
jgi:predicted transport protein